MSDRSDAADFHAEPRVSADSGLERIGLIGLGLLGSALGTRLFEQGVAVIGFDIDAASRERFRDAGCDVADSLREMAACREIILSLPDSNAARRVIDELRPLLEPGTAIIDTTTGAPTDAEEAAAMLALQSVEYLDATVGGSSGQTRRGEAIIMCGATSAGFARCRGTLERLAERVFHTGAPGSGSRMKLVTNLVLGLNRAVLAEGLAFAASLGLDECAVLDVLQAGPAESRVMATKGRRMIDREFSPEARLRQHAKDVDLILAAARNAGQTVPLSERHRELLTSLVARGLGDLDNSSIREAF